MPPVGTNSFLQCFSRLAFTRSRHPQQAPTQRGRMTPTNWRLNMKKFSLLGMALSLMIATSALCQDVRYNYDKGTDFSKFKTYKWGPHQRRPEAERYRRQTDQVRSRFSTSREGFDRSRFRQRRSLHRLPDRRRIREAIQLLQQRNGAQAGAMVGAGMEEGGTAEAE